MENSILSLIVPELSFLPTRKVKAWIYLYQRCKKHWNIVYLVYDYSLINYLVLV
jgi:hypothetical protein